jgi:hypothetical protein
MADYGDGEVFEVRHERTERQRLFTCLESWQLEDVEQGRVGGAAHAMYHRIQTYGRQRRVCWPSAGRLARDTGIDTRNVRSRIATLIRAGWIVSVPAENGTHREMVLPDERGGRMLSVRTPDAFRPDPPDAQHQAPPGCSASPKPDEEENQMKHTHAAADGQDGGRRPPNPPTVSLDPGKDPEPDPESRSLEATCGELAEALLAAYPHGVTESGRRRKPSRTVVVNRLRVVLRPVRGEERAALAARVRRGAELEADAAPPEGDDQRRYLQGLDVWVTARGWESPPEFARPARCEASRRMPSREEQAARIAAKAPHLRQLDLTDRTPALLAPTTGLLAQARLAKAARLAEAFRVPEDPTGEGEGEEVTRGA